MEVVEPVPTAWHGNAQLRQGEQCRVAENTRQMALVLCALLSLLFYPQTLLKMSSEKDLQGPKNIRNLSPLYGSPLNSK